MGSKKNLQSAGKQKAAAPSNQNEKQQNKTARQNAKLLKVVFFWLLLMIPFIIFTFMLNFFSSRIKQTVTAKVNDTLPKYADVLEKDYKVDYEYYRTVSSPNKPRYIAMARITFYGKDSARLQTAKIDEIKNSFIQEQSYRNIMNEYVVLIAPVTFVYTDGSAYTFCQDAFPLSDRGQNGGIVDTKYYERCAAPLTGIWLIAVSFPVFWGFAYGFYMTQIKRTNKLTDTAQEGPRKMTQPQKD